ncbi:YihY/virulence factor BrkB family protein [Paracoccus rhizosphaerae]|uniref:YihY/virulence factor BrkB family protein n=1 Tax=Paracoccus rhizosphaerae TaxID=1133347 RepID=A0ABV6CF48_9RHOB|nr:YihY/virulence factor BrkB family protein [Paracoccus rhizosphaerae]
MIRIQDLGPKRFLRELVASINDDNVFNGAAALGFFLTMAIFPGLIVLMSVIPYLPIADIDTTIMDLLRQALPSEAAVLLQDVVTEVTQQQRGGALSFGLLATLWIASSGMYAIMQQLNITYGVKEARSLVRGRFTAIVLSLLFGVFVLGAMSLIVAGGSLEHWVTERFGTSASLATAFAVLRWIVILCALLLGHAFFYKFGPNVEQRFRFITPGSVFSTIVLVVASLLFSLYISNFGTYDATYGSIGAVIILMFWLYIAGFVMLVGSEINALLEHHSKEGKRKGEKELPDP